MTLSQLSLTYAISQIGVTEMPKGSNRGPEVEIYLRSIGLGGGYPWCMAFVYYCVQQAAKENKFVNPLSKTGGVLLQSQRMASKSNRTPKIGSVFIMDFGNGAGHSGFVESIDGNYINTVEGNTDGNGSRTGGQVMRLRRPISKIKTFIHLD